MGTIYTYKHHDQCAVKYPKYILVPVKYWTQTITSGVKNDERIHLSARKRKERAS